MSDLVGLLRRVFTEAIRDPEVASDDGDFHGDSPAPRPVIRAPPGIRRSSSVHAFSPTVVPPPWDVTKRLPEPSARDAARARHGVGVVATDGRAATTSAPPSRSARAASRRVAPVVTTSSTSTNRRPAHAVVEGGTRRSGCARRIGDRERLLRGGAGGPERSTGATRRPARASSSPNRVDSRDAGARTGSTGRRAARDPPVRRLGVERVDRRHDGRSRSVRQQRSASPVRPSSLKARSDAAHPAEIGERRSRPASRRRAPPARRAGRDGRPAGARTDARSGAPHPAHSTGSTNGERVEHGIASIAGESSGDPRAPGPTCRRPSRDPRRLRRTLLLGGEEGDGHGASRAASQPRLPDGRCQPMPGGVERSADAASVRPLPPAIATPPARDPVVEVVSARAARGRPPWSRRPGTAPRRSRRRPRWRRGAAASSIAITSGSSPRRVGASCPVAHDPRGRRAAGPRRSRAQNSDHRVPSRETSSETSVRVRPGARSNRLHLVRPRRRRAASGFRPPERTRRNPYVVDDRAR